MNAIYKNKSYYERIFLIFIFCLPFIKFFIEYNVFNLRFIDDTQGSYSYFQYIYNYFGEFYQLPIWIDYIDGGLPSSFIIQHELSLFSVFFIIIGNLIKLNPYWAFILLILFFNILFLFGLYLNLKNIHNNHEIFVVVAFIHLISFDLLFHLHSLISLSYLPFSYYYIHKYFSTFKFTKLKQLALINLLFFFFHIHYYNIIILIYLPLLIFIIFCFLKFRDLKNHINKEKIIKIFNFKNLAWFFSFTLLSIFFLLLTKLQLNEYNSSSFGRSNYQVQYQSFIDFYKIPITKIMNWFFNETFLLLSLNPGPVGISLILISLIYFNYLKTNKVFILTLVILIISFYISGSHNFFFLKEIIGKIFFYLPLTEYIRGLHNLLSLSKFFVLLLISFSVKVILDQKFNKKKNLIFLIVINLLYTEIFFSINYNSIDTRIWIPFVLGINIFIFFQFLKFKKKMSSLIIIIFLCTLPYYLKSFTFNEYYNGDNYKKIDYINKTDSINLDKICFKKSDIKEIYSIYFNQDILPLSKHNQFFLNTKLRPCNVILNQRLRGSKKKYDIKNNSAKASFIDDNFNFKIETEVNEKKYFTKNYFLLNNYQNKTDININNAGSYSIKTDTDKIYTTFSYTKNWKITGNEKQYALKNNNGLLEINILDKNFKNFQLYYDNNLIKLNIYIFIILSFLSYISLCFITLKKIKT